ncbi:MAG TPA: glycosyltransferase family 4 protein [Chthoniobacterales bacterium]
MRILQIFNRYLQFGGEESSVYQIGDALQSLHEVEYFLTSTESWITRRNGNRLAMLLDSFHNQYVLNRLRRYQTLGKFDIWQIHNVLPAMSSAVYAEAFRQGIPIVHYLHNYRLSCVNGFFLNHGEPCMRCIQGNFFPAFQTACWRDSRWQSGAMGAVLMQMRSLQVFQKVARWVAISQRQKEIHVQMGLPEERIHVIPHFLECHVPPLPPSKEPVILFVGRLSVEKGVFHLLNAWARLKTKSAQLLIVGDGPERPALEAQAAKLSLHGVSFRGFLSPEQQTELWRRAVASVVPSIWEETFGKVVLEAWGRGRPVIGHRIGALPELIEPGVTGLLAATGDAGALAGAMDQLLANPASSAEMGRQGHAMLLEKFSRERWLSQIRKIYETL